MTFHTPKSFLISMDGQHNISTKKNHVTHYNFIIPAVCVIWHALCCSSETTAIIARVILIYQGKWMTSECITLLRLISLFLAKLQLRSAPLRRFKMKVIQWKWDSSKPSRNGLLSLELPDELLTSRLVDKIVKSAIQWFTPHIGSKKIYVGMYM